VLELPPTLDGSAFSEFKLFDVSAELVLFLDQQPVNYRGGESIALYLLIRISDY
jgi:hypothetical protein